MIDREKVINALEEYEPYAREFDSLSVYGWVVLDALTLLKEQEPKTVEDKTVKPVPRPTEVKGICPHCKSIIVFRSGQFCDKCGEAVKWE